MGFSLSIRMMIPKMLCLSGKVFPVRILIRNLHREGINVKWEKPGRGWTKLNYDGSCRWSSGNSGSIGGIFRDHDARFLLGYAESLGQRSDSMVAESVALLRGLEIAIENGLNDVWIEGDSKGLIDLVSKGKYAKSATVRMNVEQINTLMREMETCILTHTYREGNRAADKFAELGHSCKYPMIWKGAPPLEVKLLVEEDAVGKTFLRRKR